MLFTIIFTIIISTFVYGYLIWMYLYPEEAALWGDRWKYKEEPTLTDKAIKYTKRASVIIMILYTLFLIFAFIRYDP